MSELSAPQNFIENLQKIAASGMVSHAYIMEGEGSGSLLQAAKEFAKALGSSAADILFPEHEKPNLISVDDIRRGINESVYIRPYNSPRKVYIVEDAEKMNPQAQNALLKTLEEPPQYVVILLLTANAEIFLPTILSRCVKLRMLSAENLQDQEEDGKAAAGLAKEIIRSTPSMDTKQMLDFVSRMSGMKNQLEDILEAVREYLRDILVYKAEGDEKLLIHAEELSAVRTIAERISFSGISRVSLTLDRTERRLNANVNTDLSLELLLMALREETQRR